MAMITPPPAQPHCQPHSQNPPATPAAQAPETSETPPAPLATLKVASINVNSLVSHSKRYDLLNFLTENKIDIALICETKLNSRHKTQFADYEIIRSDRVDSIKGGGNAILVKHNIDSEKIHFPTSTNNKIIEYTIIIKPFLSLPYTPITPVAAPSQLNSTPFVMP